MISFDDARLEHDENKSFSGLKCEIRIRTVMQHAWAASEHKLQYKRHRDVPKPFQRKLFKLAALLELADDQFLDTRNGIAEVIDSYREEVLQGQSNLPLDQESLSVYLSDSGLPQGVAGALKKLNVALLPASARMLGRLLDTLEAAKITDIKSLDERIRQRSIAEWVTSLEPVFDYWSNLIDEQGRHAAVQRSRRMTLSLAGLARLMIVLSLDRREGKKIANAVPFGENLQRALFSLISPAES